MVADFFEMDGWSVFYLGPNTPKPDIIDVVRLREADLLALSAASILHLRDLADVIKGLTEQDDVLDTRVLVGGTGLPTGP